MRYNRTNFFEVNVVDNVSECDLVMNQFDKFKITRPTNFYTVKETDLKRPDILSIKCYGKQDLFWILGKINFIDDWQNDLSVGDVLIVPNIQDIEDWILNVRKA
jgi:hypothetical protein